MHKTGRLKPWETPVGAKVAAYYRDRQRLARLQTVIDRVNGDIRDLTLSVRWLMSTPRIVAKYGFTGGGGGGDSSDACSDMLGSLEHATEEAKRKLPKKARRLVSLKIRLHALRERQAVVECALDTLTNNQRRVVEMIYFQRMRKTEIAKSMRMSETNVRWIHSQAMTILVQCFTKAQASG